VDVGLIPGFVGLNTLQDRVVGRKEDGLKHAGFMGFESTSDKVDETRFVAKTSAGAMDRKKSMTGFYEGQKGVELFGGYAPMVGVKYHRIELIEIFCSEAIGLGLVVELDCLAFDALCEDGKVLVGVVVGACVAQKKNAHRSWRSSEGEGCVYNEGEQGEKKVAEHESGCLFLGIRPHLPRICSALSDNICEKSDILPLRKRSRAPAFT